MNKLEKKELYNQLFKLAIPISLQSLIMAVLYLVDQLMVGQLWRCSDCFGWDV
ncbi:hypothetical protein [Paenibacillus sp.]|uniref:hypothetical protein n=1 Tax=Paenibacillus sp. TaxID=58172 RepID=UPI0028AF3541|nr:hypothetical protein [Paenibacillus sp.]